MSVRELFGHRNRLVFNKKAAKGFYEWWAETIAIILLAIGFIVGILTGSMVMTYLVVTLCGMMFGRLWYRNRDNFKFTWFLMILGFIIGYVLGNTLGNYYGNNYSIISLFLFGIIFSYYLHAKKYIKSAEY